MMRRCTILFGRAGILICQHVGFCKILWVVVQISHRATSIQFYWAIFHVNAVVHGLAVNVGIITVDRGKQMHFGNGSDTRK